MDSKGQSLDDTLKDLLNEEDVDTKKCSDESKETSTEEKPKKRGRRSKAEIEAEEAAKAEDVASEESSDESKQEESSESTEPEVIPDTDDDKENESSEEEMIPEVVPDTEEDLQPDPEEPADPKKKVDPGRVTQSAAEAAEAFKEKESQKISNSIIGQTKVVKDQTPLYRGPHVSLRSGHYKGLVTFISEITSGFVKVQYLRTGFGLCEGWMFIGDLTLWRGDDEDEGVEIS